MLEHLERLAALRALDLPDGIERQVHQNRLLKMAREGGQMMTRADLAKFESAHRHATLVAVALEAKATVIDEIIKPHDRIIGTLFNRAKHRHQQEFQQSGKAINDKGEAVLAHRRCLAGGQTNWGRSLHRYDFNTRPFMPRSSMSACAMPPMCWMACSY